MLSPPARSRKAVWSPTQRNATAADDWSRVAQLPQLFLVGSRQLTKCWTLPDLQRYDNRKSLIFRFPHFAAGVSVSHSSDVLPMDESDVLPLEDASTIWRQLATRVEDFVNAWEAGGPPPSIARHLDEGSTLAAKRLTAIELVKIDLEYRWLHRKQPRPLEDYLREFDFLAADIPVDLIYEECHVRRQSGETFKPEDVYRRFPKHEPELRRLFGAAPALQTTTMMGHKKNPKAALEPGQRVDDFELISKLGEGAFGSVFLARQRSMQRIVALKVTADHGSEPQTLAQLDHENIVRVYDQRQLVDSGLRLMYMQFASGGSLEGAMDRMRMRPIENRTGRDFLAIVDESARAKGETPSDDSIHRARLQNMTWPEVVCFLGAKLARALDYAHHSGVLHRDVKPANVLLTGEGVPKLADFNISFSSKLEGATPAAYFGGSLAYMSPEQLEACNPAHDRKPEELDGRSDLYSLGVLLWELLSGLKPFEDVQVDRSWTLTLQQMTERRKRGPAKHALKGCLNPQAPGLDDVLVRSLSATVSERYASGSEMARHLELCMLPRTQRLLAGRRDGWRGIIAKHPVATAVVLTILPNAVAGAFNYIYNRDQIIGLLDEQGKEVFHQTQMIMNAALFPLGALIGAYRTINLARCVSNDKLRNALSDAQAAEYRRSCLLLGRDAALIGMALWFFAGLGYPALMHLGMGHAQMNLYTHFMASMLLCGLVAAAYPFMLLTLLSLRRFYPLFVRLEKMNRNDRADLEKLKRLSWGFLILAALVPVTAVMMLALIKSEARYALMMSSFCGAVGFGFSYLGLRTILADIDALALVTHGEIRRPLLSNSVQL